MSPRARFDLPTTLRRAVPAALLALTGCNGCEPPAESVCGDCLDTDGFRIEYPDPVSPDRPAVLLFSGWRNGYCQYDVLCTGTTETFLGDVRWNADDFDPEPDLSQFCDKEELLAFVAGRSPSSPSVSSWFFNAAAKVPVTLWRVKNQWPPDDKWLEVFQDQEVAAGNLYRDLGTGITFEVTKPSVLVDVSPDPSATYFDCANPKKFRNKTAADGYDPGYDPSTINVYFVSEVRPGAHALTCQPDDQDPNGPWDVILLSKGSYVHALAHELGHALGLVRSAPLASGGTVWTGDVGTEMDRHFGGDNLMYYNDTDPNSLTLGQIYRMHYDVKSWLGRRQLASPTGPPMYPLNCQDDPVSHVPCPPLPLGPPRGWP